MVLNLQKFSPSPQVQTWVSGDFFFFLMEALLRGGVYSKSRQQDHLIWFKPAIKEQPDAFGGKEGTNEGMKEEEIKGSIKSRNDKAFLLCIESLLCFLLHADRLFVWCRRETRCHTLYLFTPRLGQFLNCDAFAERFYCDLIKEMAGGNASFY